MNEKSKIILTAVLSLVTGALVSMAAMHHHGMDMSKHAEKNTRMHGSENIEGGMHAEMNMMMAELSGKTGDSFDQAFLSEMITHHEGAVLMAEAALENARHQEIKELAQMIISAQNTEIAQMKEWQKKWYPN